MKRGEGEGCSHLVPQSKGDGNRMQLEARVLESDCGDQGSRPYSPLTCCWVSLGKSPGSPSGPVCVPHVLRRALLIRGPKLENIK